jgi:hypothetical protein
LRELADVLVERFVWVWEGTVSIDWSGRKREKKQNAHFHPKSFSTRSAEYENFLLGSSSVVALSVTGGRCFLSSGWALIIERATCVQVLRSPMRM